MNTNTSVHLMENYVINIEDKEERDVVAARFGCVPDGQGGFMLREESLVD
jgi:hypothetical protein